MSEKLFFVNDYGEGCHPKVLEKLAATNMEHLAGYGSDKYCESAKEKIRAACECPEADIWFISGGTQTNAIVISALLKSYEGVVSAVTGHINGHEAGAVEHLGRKVLPLPQHEGKICACELKEMLRTFYGDANHEHMVFPGMVYISHPTEYGTLYTKEELTAVSSVCREYQIPLFMDGARMGYGLMSYQTDVTLPDIAKLCDVFYIGGTKVGALCGEAVVFTRGNMPKHFLPIVKQNGALLAKGRLMGVQFDTLFTDNLYFDISRHAIEMAEELKKVFAEKGYRFFIDSPTNQQFIVLENEKMQALGQFVDFSFWEKLDDNHTVVRFATSWATRKEDIDKLAALL
ncbi:MAG: aminotransferase class V-fold PLP-dependent enzyme [Clostridia bacterium]|nr:aminotransferase class V-fold PLP-dependent enzyme [Clostridia bacterium]